MQDHLPTQAIKEGSKVVVSLNYGSGTIRGEVEYITLNGVWVRLENGNPRLCQMSDLKEVK